MVRGKPPIKTRQEIIDYLNKNMLEKGLDKEAVPKGGLLFQWYMENFTSDKRPTVTGMAEIFHLSRPWMRLLIERWEQNIQ